VTSRSHTQVLVFNRYNMESFSRRSNCCTRSHPHY